MLFWSYISSECELRDEFIVKIEPVKSLQTFGKDIKITVVCTNPQTVIRTGYQVKTCFIGLKKNLFNPYGPEATINKSQQQWRIFMLFFFLN